MLIRKIGDNAILLSKNYHSIYFPIAYLRACLYYSISSYMSSFSPLLIPQRDHVPWNSLLSLLRWHLSETWHTLSLSGCCSEDLRLIRKHLMKTCPSIALIEIPISLEIPARHIDLLWKALHTKLNDLYLTCQMLNRNIIIHWLHRNVLNGSLAARNIVICCVLITNKWFILYTLYLHILYIFLNGKF